MRRLVTIRQIAVIDPIPNADAIECATIDGWKVVVKKGEIQGWRLLRLFRDRQLSPGE